MSEQQQAAPGIPVYEWRTAPTNLRTRRQLAAEGLRPNGQDIAAKVHRFRGQRQQPVTAYLYDINLAAAKRQATPAQLAALEKATRERQLRAAERHGVDRAEFEQAGDPGPAWAETSTAPAVPHAFANATGHVFAASTEREGMER